MPPAVGRVLIVLFVGFPLGALPPAWGAPPGPGSRVTKEARGLKAHSPGAGAVSVLVPSGIVMAALLLNSPDALDDRIRAFSQRNRTPVGDDIARAFSSLGSIGGAGALGLAYVVGTARRDEALKTTVFLSAASGALATGASFLVKEAFRRRRPSHENSRSDDFFLPGSGKSFPSAHTAFAFSVASVWAARRRPGAAYCLAGLVGLSRVVLNDHWASDVLGGALLGYGSGRVVLSVYGGSLSHRRVLLPFSPEGGAGLTWQVRF